MDRDPEERDTPDRRQSPAGSRETDERIAGAGEDAGDVDPHFDEGSGDGAPVDVSEQTTDTGMAPGTGQPGGTNRHW